jgi:subtilisin family serine protease
MPFWSDYGSCIDRLAPGVDITSDWNTNDTATVRHSGTSMAGPHTTGAVAQYLQGNPTASPGTGTPRALRGHDQGRGRRQLHGEPHLRYSRR